MVSVSGSTPSRVHPVNWKVIACQALLARKMSHQVLHMLSKNYSDWDNSVLGSHSERDQGEDDRPATNNRHKTVGFVYVSEIADPSHKKACGVIVACEVITRSKVQGETLPAFEYVISQSWHARLSPITVHTLLRLFHIRFVWDYICRLMSRLFARCDVLFHASPSDSMFRHEVRAKIAKVNQSSTWTVLICMHVNHPPACFCTWRSLLTSVLLALSDDRFRFPALKVCGSIDYVDSDCNRPNRIPNHRI